MNEAFDAAYFEGLRGRLRALLIAVAHWFSRDQTALLNELIDANECGVALEMTSDFLVEAGACVDPAVRDDVVRLAATLELPPGVAGQLEPCVTE